MKVADIIFWHDEPVSFGSGLCQQLLRYEMCAAAIAMPYDHAGVMRILRQSKSDCVVFISPHMHADFIRCYHKELLTLGKPLLGIVSEWISGNDVFPQLRAFHAENDWLHYYGVMQASDVIWLRSLGMKAEFLKMLFASDLFAKGPQHNRRKQICYIGHNNAWKTERIRIVQTLEEAGLICSFSAPRNLVGANGIAALFREFSAVLCPPAHGRAHSIRCYEAAAAGALLIECQPLDDGNEFFIEGQHRIAFPVGMSRQDMCNFVRSIDHDKTRHIAEAGCALVHQQCRAEVGFSRFLDAARRALTV